METVVRSIILSLIAGICCQIFFDTVLPKHKWRSGWIEHTAVFAFTAGFMLIAVTEIPPYVLQPVRLIVVVGVIVFIYYRANILRTLALSVLFCGLYWLVSTVILSVEYFRSDFVNRLDGNMIETITECVFLCIVMLFHYGYKRRFHGLQDARWEKFSIFPLLSMVVIVAICVIPWSETAADRYARFTAVAAFAVMNVWVFYFVTNLLEKEEEMQNLRLSKERARSQMNMYHSMQKSYEQQRRRLHDDKNRLTCMQGMLEEGKIEETLAYIARLTGKLKSEVDYVNTNNTVVNVILNQKYQAAYEKGITVTFAVNDLSGLPMDEEALVMLLSNLLDNAIEACEKLDGNKVIQCKMMIEDVQLILSVRNPVKGPVRIKGKTIVTSKKESSSHGIGLLNVDSVIRNYAGTSALTCKDGWFCFSAMIPLA